MSRSRILSVAGGALIAATWLYLVLVRPTDWDEVGGSTEAIVTLVGYLGGAVLLLAGTVPHLPAAAIALIPAALVLNIVVGEVVGSVGVPLYLDAIGSALVAVLAGSRAGLATGALSSIVWSLFNPTTLPFAAVSALIGWLIGLAHEHGFMRSLWRAIPTGLVIGLVSGAAAAPVAAFVYGGTAGVGTGALVSLFREMGGSLLESVTLQSFISDPIDKAIVLALAYGVVRALPQRTLRALRPSEAGPGAGEGR